MADTIVIRDYELWTRIGVPEEERRREQRVLVTAKMELVGVKAGLTDNVEDTVDYEKIAKGIRELVKGERRTLEKLVEDIVSVILKERRIQHVTVTLRKFILPGTREVACTIARSR